MTTLDFISQNRRQIILISLVFIIMIILYGRIDANHSDYRDWDLHQYLMMAEKSPSLSQDIPQPFAYRILGPYLAGLLPFDLDMNFYLISLAASAILIFLFYFFLCSMGIDATIAAIVVIIFIFNKYFFGFTIWNFYQLNDILALIFIILIFLSMHRQHWIRYTLFLAVGSLARETVMLLIPVAFIYILETKKSGKHLIYWAAASLPGILIFLLLRLLITPSGGDDLLSAFMRYYGKLGSPGPWAGLLIYCTIPVSLIPVIYCEQTIAFFRNRKYMLLYIVLIFISALFGSNNERLMAPVFVVFYFLIASILTNKMIHRRWPICIILAAAFISSLDIWSGLRPLPDRETMIIIDALCLTAVTLISILNKIKQVSYRN
ncbi:MAG: hypothetical protein AB1746_11690 [Candidatus Zixiibacteriota bacterium]